MYALRAYISKFVLGKKNSRIEKTIKTFSIFDKIFSKNSILTCALSKSVLGKKKFRELKKLLKLFQFSIKLFLKIVYYRVPLGYTLVKSL